MDHNENSRYVGKAGVDDSVKYFDNYIDDVKLVNG